MLKNNLWYTNPATCFEEAIPIGNGSFGGMVYCDPINDKISINHDTLWTGVPKRTVKEHTYEAYHSAQQLVLDGKISEAEKLLQSDFNADWTQRYCPMGNIHIKSSITKYEKYKRELFMNEGIVRVTYENNGNKCKREYFATNPNDGIFIDFSEGCKQDYELSFDRMLLYYCNVENASLVIDGGCPPHPHSDSGNTNYSCLYDGENITFTTVIRIHTDGEIANRDNTIYITGATKTRFYVCTETSFIDYNTAPKKEHHKACIDKADLIDLCNYEYYKEQHIKDFNDLYNRTVFEVSSDMSDIPTDEIIKAEKVDAILPVIMYNFGKYILISSSRPFSQATNLQGIWNEEYPAPWASNYTININTEMNYWPVYACNLTELAQPLIDLVRKLCDTGKTTAKEYYNAPGSVSHHVTDLWGMSTPSGPQTPNSCRWAFWNMSLGWLMRSVFEKYEYTLDADYLKNTAYPLMKQAAEFYSSILIEYNGKLIISPSTSPENAYISEGEEHGLAKYTAMSQEILIELFENCIKSCEILKIDEHFKNKIQKIIPRLYIFEIGSKGQLLEWDDEYEETDLQHRHVSHLYGVYPATIFTENQNENLYNAARKSLEIRSDIGTGWSIAWKINLWAKFKDGDHSFKAFENQMHFVENNANKNDERFRASGEANTKVIGGTYLNLFDAHPPFQIDGNFGVMSGIILWFLQCEDNVIKILPALPKILKCGKIQGLLAKGNITVSIEWKDGLCTCCTAVSPIKQMSEFIINKQNITIMLEKNKTIKII